MKFNKVFRGYDPKQVDNYVAEQEKKHKEVGSSQKRRIDELADENAELRAVIAKYREDESAISKALIASNKLASELKGDAEKFSELTLSRAKIFYATWYAYSQTFVSALSGEEVRQFNLLKLKVERIINAYEGQNVQQFAAEVAQKIAAEADDVAATATGTERVNPIEKVVAVAHEIELEELLKPTQSLADLCRDLGLHTDEK